MTLYRKYREGEVPDVQIKPQEIIEPLQALLQKDASLARLVFAQCFTALFAAIPEVALAHSLTCLT